MKTKSNRYQSSPIPQHTQQDVDETEVAFSRQHPMTMESKSPEPIQPSLRLSVQRKLVYGDSAQTPETTDSPSPKQPRLSGWLRLQLNELKQTTASAFSNSGEETPSSKVTGEEDDFPPMQLPLQEEL